MRNKPWDHRRVSAVAMTLCESEVVIFLGETASKPIMRKKRIQPILEDVVVPADVCDLESFRVWGDSLAYPEWGRVEFYDGHVHLDLSKEELFRHVGLRTEIMRQLMDVVEQRELGRIFGRRATYVNVVADFSLQPDGFLVSINAEVEGRCRFVASPQGGYNEIEGIVDLVIEVVDDSSVVRDKLRMPELYAKAGIPEFWLIDARARKLEFDIFRLSPDGYVPTRRRNGWLESVSLGASFRLSRRTARDGYPEFTLHVK